PRGAGGGLVPVALATLAGTTAARAAPLARAAVAASLARAPVAAVAAEPALAGPAVAVAAAARAAAAAAAAARTARGDLALELGPHQVDLPALVDRVDLDLEAVALLEEVLDALDAALGDLADVQQAVGAGEEGDEGAELGGLGHDAVVLLADLGRGRERLDLRPHGVRGLRVLGVDAYGAVLEDLDRRAQRLELADLLAAGADDDADLVDGAPDLEDARGAGRELGPRPGQRLGRRPPGVRGLRDCGVDAYGAVLEDLDRRAQRLELADLLAAGADDDADLVDGDPDLEDARGAGRELGTRTGQRLGHPREDVE